MYKDFKFSFPIDLSKVQKKLKLDFENGLCYRGILDENSIQVFYDDIGQVYAFGDIKTSKEKFRKSNIYAVSFENIDTTYIKKYVSDISQKYHTKFNCFERPKINVKRGSIFYNFEPNFYKANLSEEVVIIIYQYFNKQINKNIISISFCYKLEDAEIEEFIGNRGFITSRYLSKISSN